MDRAEENRTVARLNAFGRGRIQQLTSVRELQRPNNPSETETQPSSQSSATTVKTEVLAHSHITSRSHYFNPSPRYWTVEKQDAVLNAASLKPFNGKEPRTCPRRPMLPPKLLPVSRPNVCTDRRHPERTSYKGYEKSYLHDLLAKEQDKDQPKMHEEIW